MLVCHQVTLLLWSLWLNNVEKVKIFNSEYTFLYPYLVVVYKFCYKISNTFLTKLLLFGLINNQITIYIQILTICCTLICTHPWDVQEVLRSTWRCDIGNHKWSCEWLYVCEGTEWQYVSNFTNYKVQYMKMYMLMCYDVIVLVYRLWLQDCQSVWQLLKVWKDVHVSVWRLLKT